MKIVRFAFFAVFLCFAMMSIKLSIKADERNFDWRNNSDGTITIIRYNGVYMEFSFPDELNGKKVAKVSSGVFGKREFSNVLPIVY
ncbi:hypothetical protein ACIQXF_15865 [Lysinibacillus sp. NPDC097231]|uniref:hypothetical protein n=1 Tax=Lysinibacillus sp. NPDC097231 TaxID=3364142 RepID=UPI003820AF74